MSLVDAYKEELNSYCQGIRESLAQMRGGVDQDTWNTCYTQANDLLTKANDIVKAMELEIRTCGATERRQHTEKLRVDKEALASFRTELTNLDFEKQKANLMGGKSGDHRRRMIDANEKIANQNLVIEQALRTVAETEDVGHEIIDELKSNREKIESASVKAKEVGGMTDAANKLIKRMTKREWSLGFF